MDFFEQPTKTKVCASLVFEEIKLKPRFLLFPKYPDPSKVDPCYTGSNPSIAGSKDP